MKPFTTKIRLGLGLALTVLAAGVMGCADHRQAPPEQTNAAIAGADMQKNGIMSQSDYIRIRALSHRVTQTHTISDEDLNWTLDLLKSAKNSVARARAFTTLSEIRPLSSARKAEILPAISPYLSSTDRLDQLGAQRVQKAAQAAG